MFWCLNQVVGREWNNYLGLTSQEYGFGPASESRSMPCRDLMFLLHKCFVLDVAGFVSNHCPAAIVVAARILLLACMRRYTAFFWQPPESKHT